MQLGGLRVVAKIEVLDTVGVVWKCRLRGWFGLHPEYDRVTCDSIRGARDSGMGWVVGVGGKKKPRNVKNAEGLLALLRRPFVRIIR